MDYKQKYLKYKSKYVALKNDLEGGAPECADNDIVNCRQQVLDFGYLMKNISLLNINELRKIITVKKVTNHLKFTINNDQILNAVRKLNSNQFTNYLNMIEKVTETKKNIRFTVDHAFESVKKLPSVANTDLITEGTPLYSYFLLRKNLISHQYALIISENLSKSTDKTKELYQINTMKRLAETKQHTSTINNLTDDEYYIRSEYMYKIATEFNYKEIERLFYLMSISIYQKVYFKDWHANKGNLFKSLESSSSSPTYEELNQMTSSTSDASFARDRARQEASRKASARRDYRESKGNSRYYD